MKKKLLISVVIILSSVSLFSQTCEWAVNIGGKNNENITEITVDAMGNLYVSGYYNSDKISFQNSKSLANIGEIDGFIAKYKDYTLSVLEKTNQNNISVYPNPAIDYIVIKPSEGLEASDGSDIQIFDMFGENVINIRTRRIGSLPIDISNLPPGIYFFRIGNRVEQFVKM